MFYRRVFYPRTAFSSPFDKLDFLRRQMDRLSEAFETGFPRSPSAGVYPMVNLSEDRENYYLKAELPGVKAEALDIQADAKSISVSGERTIDSENGNVKYHRKEREAGKFSRMIGLPGEIDMSKIEAHLKNGILDVVIPKAEAVKPRQIAIQ